MVDIKNYLSYDGLKLYDELIKQYIATADEAVLNQILGEIKEGDAETIAALNELVRTVTGTAGTALQGITKGKDGDFVTTTVGTKGEDKTQSVAVSVKTAALTGEEDGLVTASDAKTALDKKVDKEEGKGLSANDFTDTLKTKLEGIAAGAEVNVQADWNEIDENSDAFIKNKPANLVQDENYVHTDNNFTTDLKTKLDGIAEGAEVNYIKSVGEHLSVIDGNLTVTIPEATVTGVDETPVDGLKLQLTDKKVTLVDDGLASTLTSKNVTVRKKADTTDDQCVYEILQGETVVGTINHPKDMVVTAGEVIVASTEEGLTTGEKYLKLTIANQDKPVYIAVKDLVDVYTAGAGIAISDTNEVSVKLAEAQGNVVLDTTNGLKANLKGWEDVQSASHTHDNKEVLDGITAERVKSWDDKQDAMVAISNEEINALFPEVTSL